MFFEILPVAVCVIAAGFSFKWKRDSKRYHNLAKAKADFAYNAQIVATNQATSAAENLKACNILLVKAYTSVEECRTCVTNVDELGKHALKSAADYAVEASEHAAEAKGHSFAAEGHSLLSQKHTERVETLKNGLSEYVVETLGNIKEAELRVFYLVEDAINHAK